MRIFSLLNMIRMLHLLLYRHSGSSFFLFQAFLFVSGSHTSNSSICVISIQQKQVYTDVFDTDRPLPGRNCTKSRSEKGEHCKSLLFVRNMIVSQICVCAAQHSQTVEKHFPVLRGSPANARVGQRQVFQ